MSRGRQAAVVGVVVGIIYFVLAKATGDGFGSALLWTLVVGVVCAGFAALIGFLIHKARTV